MIKVMMKNNMHRTTAIVSEDTPVIDVLRDNDFDYEGKVLQCSGYNLSGDNLNKTFAELGFTDDVVISAVVKADNAATVKIAGDACVIESVFTPEQIATVAKYRPKALQLVDEDKNVTFGVAAGRGYGTVNKYGVEFGKSTNGDGKAIVTFVTPAGTEDRVKWVEEYIGTALLDLNKVETQIPAALDEVEHQLADIRANITVM